MLLVLINMSKYMEARDSSRAQDLFGAHLDSPKMYPTGRSVALLHFFK